MAGFLACPAKRLKDGEFDDLDAYELDFCAMTPSYKYIDLFAGCGGLSTGLHLAGWKGLFAVERNSDAFKTLKANLIEKHQHFDWPIWLAQKEWDIQKLLKEKAAELAKLKGTIDLVVGGPPCQGFSMAGRRKESDKRNQLFYSYLQFVALVEPRVIMFENVRGFTMKFKANPDSGAVYSDLILSELKKLGYHDAQGEVINTADYGVPQNRHRFIVIATKENLAPAIFETLKNSKNEFLANKGIARRNTVRSALSDLEKKHGVVTSPDTKRFMAGILAKASGGLQKCLRRGKDQEATAPDSHRFVNHTYAAEEVFKKMLVDAPRNKTIAGDERLKYGLKKRSVKVLDPDAPAPTITTIPDDFIHYSEPRVMTVRECARLQTFPDWFEFKGPYTTGGPRRVLQTPRYTQVGNAVPPLFAELIGAAIKDTLAK